MKKIIMLCLLFTFCFMTSIVGAEAVDDSVMATELYQAQSLSNLKVGKYAIPENVLNHYFSAVASQNPKVKNASISIGEKDKLVLTTEVDGIGVLRITCTIKELHFDKENAILELHIDKKELVGQGLASWLLNNISLSVLTEVYGNPLSGTDSTIKGNTLAINLKPFASSLFNSGIGRSIADQIVISKASTEPGLLYLHTNCAISILLPDTKMK